MSKDGLTRRLVRTGRRLGRPDILFWSLPWLMVLIIIGTLAQKTMGLYDAQNMFFSSFVFFWNGIPLPGGYTVLTVMAANLTCKFIFSSEWNWKKGGIHLIHLSVIILLFGGLLTAATMQEGYIALKEGEEKAFITDYHKRVLVFETPKGERTVIPFAGIRAGETVAGLPFTVRPVKKCRNAQIIAKTAPSKDGAIGAAAMVDMNCADPLNDSERNRGGLVYEIGGAAAGENGVYIVFEGRQTQDEILGKDGASYRVTVERAQRTLPFAIELTSFQRDVYAGTDMPRSYESMVRVHDGGIDWPARIAMNEPLRYKGYTFYQASTWIDADGEAVSVLSAVTNTGWVFPYIAGIMLALGLIYHVVMEVRKRL